MCICDFACKSRPRNDLYCVGRDVKPYSLTALPHGLSLFETNIVAKANVDDGKVIRFATGFRYTGRLRVFNSVIKRGIGLVRTCFMTHGVKVSETSM